MIFAGCVEPSSRAAGTVVANNVCLGSAFFGLFLFLSVGGWEGKRVLAFGWLIGLLL